MPSFSSVVGHRRVTALLSSAIARGTLPPTLLFAGPAGVGKFLVARACATAINCESPIPFALSSAGTEHSAHRTVGTPGTLGTLGTLEACGHCRACNRVARNMHVDIAILEPDDRASIKIDVVREVLERTAFRPFEGRHRMVLIRDADALEPSAQNALLKSLEEPPATTSFILTTAVPDVLLPTVRSRCMRLRFGRLTESEVADVLIREHELAAEEALAFAALADGSVGQALGFGSTDLALLREIAIELLRQTAGSAPLQSRLKAGQTLVTGGSKKDRSRDEVALILRIVASMLRDIELLNAGGDARALANAILSDQLGALTRSYGGDRARRAFGAVDRALAALERNAGPKAVADWVAAQI